MVQRDSGVADLFGVVPALRRGVLGIDKNGLVIETNNKLNMNKEPDFFSNITPTSGGLIIIALGVLLLIGAIRRWKWVFDMTGERNKGFNFLLFLYDLFGDKGLRVGVIITSVIIILGGIGIMCFGKQ